MRDGRWSLDAGVEPGVGEGASDWLEHRDGDSAADDREHYDIVSRNTSAGHSWSLTAVPSDMAGSSATCEILSVSCATILEFCRCNGAGT